MKKVLKVLEYIIFAILIIILSLNIVIMIKANKYPNKVPSIFGYKPFVVVSGSMQTKIDIGDLIFVKEVDVNTLEINDIIAFRDQKNLVTTHRIINIIKTDNGICFETKGDSNNIKDENLVYPDSVEGKYVKKIAKLGNVVIFIQKPLGFGIMMITILLIGIIIFMLENKKIDKEFKFKNEEERKEFEEFKRAKELSKKEEKNNSKEQ